MSKSPSTLILAEPKGNYQLDDFERKIMEVLVDCPGVQGLYTYYLPKDLTVSPGDIVSVPFGAQITGGIAIRFLKAIPTDLQTNRIKEVEDVITTGFFPPSYWQLMEQVARYYCTDLMTVIRVALPPGLLGKSQRRIRLKKETLPPGAKTFCNIVSAKVLELLEQQPQGDYSERYIQRQIKGASKGIRDLIKRGWVESYLEAPKNVSPKLQQIVTLIVEDVPANLTSKQTEVLETLRSHDGELWLQDLLELCHTSASVITRLQSQGCLVIEARERLRFFSETMPAADKAKELNDSQSRALAAINDLQSFKEVLLHGVTGSGKTEVYLQAIASVLAEGKSALVLVPEIGLTPQLTDRFRARFGERILVYHSALSNGERYDTWRSLLQGEAQIIIGTRSAVFTPIQNLGLIILDEEHDVSFKQERPAPTYHARTVARIRAELAHCPLILGTATPALETWIKATQTGESIYLSMPERIQSRPLPPIEIVDLREELHQGNRSIFSRALQQALREMHQRQQQGILFIPRRGHSSFVSCRSCGYVMDCPHCDVSLSYHYTEAGAPELLRCHYCNHTSIHPQNCPECGSPYLKFFGSGTQKVTQELNKLFPQIRCLRFDSDTTRTKGAHRRLLNSFARGQADLLVGTQMLTKGIDLAQVTLVGVVAADGLLHRSDYRAAEQAWQILTQVAGRAGRGEDAGKVIIQTYTPEHPVLQTVANYDYQGFVTTELTQRAELNYPPYGKLILIKLSSLDAIEVEQSAEQIRELCQTIMPPEGEILGPAPAPIMRVADRYRWQILLKFPPKDENISINLEILRIHCPRAVNMTIDVDPLNMDG